MKNLISLTIILLLFTSCATLDSLDEYYAGINYEDGINRDEAKLIAKKYLVESSYEGQFQVWGPIVTGEENDWVVSFLYKRR